MNKYCGPAWLCHFALSSSPVAAMSAAPTPTKQFYSLRPGRQRAAWPSARWRPSAGDALEGVWLDEAEQVARHPPDLDFLGPLGDAVPAVVAVDVLERLVP